MTGALEDESADESALVAALCAGYEFAFAQLVDRYTAVMLRVARGYVRSRETAEEVVQETWIALIKGISKFEGRSSSRNWLFTVMINIAKARGVRERRNFDAEVAAFTGGTVDPALFRGPGEEWPGDWKNWEEYPRAFPESPEGSVLAREIVAVAQAELERLPDGQRMVVTLRNDPEGDRARHGIPCTDANERRDRRDPRPRPHLHPRSPATAVPFARGVVDRRTIWPGHFMATGADAGDTGTRLDAGSCHFSCGRCWLPKRFGCVHRRVLHCHVLHRSRRGRCLRPGLAVVAAVWRMVVRR